MDLFNLGAFEATEDHTGTVHVFQTCLFILGPGSSCSFYVGYFGFRVPLDPLVTFDLLASFFDSAPWVVGGGGDKCQTNPTYLYRIF